MSNRGTGRSRTAGKGLAGLSRGTLGLIGLAIVATVLAVVSIVTGSEPVSVSASSSAPLPVDAGPSQPAIVFLGDSYTGGSDMGGNGPANYTRVLADRLHLTTINLAVGGTGYVEGGQGASPFSTQVSRLARLTNVAVVVIEGSRNDVTHPAPQVNQAATAVYASLRQVQPAAKVVVVGPLVPVGPPVQPAMFDTRDAVKAASAGAGLPFIDPIAEKWLPINVIGSDGVHPTDAGHVKLADRMQGDLSALHLLPGT